MCYLSGGLFHQNKSPVNPPVRKEQIGGSVLSLATCVLLFNQCDRPCPLHIIYITSTSSIQKQSFVNVLENWCS